MKGYLIQTRLSQIVFYNQKSKNLKIGHKKACNRP